MYQQRETETDKKTYRRIRRAIGYLGIFLPVLLVCFSLIPLFKTSVQPSISDYYYSNLREIFTGTLCAIGLFLIRYVGYKGSSFWENDNLFTNIAGYLAIGVAFIPTNPDIWTEKIYTLLPYNIKFLGYMHYAFAAILFILLSFISIKIFTIGQDTDLNTSHSFFNENNIYRICGYLMLVFIILTPIFSIFDIFSYSTLTFEALILLSFGISWLIKGRALGDKGKIGETLYREIN
jgi:hypothetical protein